VKSQSKKKSKVLYSLTVFLVRVLPMITSLAILLNIIFSCNCNGEICSIIPTVLSNIFGISFIGILTLFILSRTYKFCAYHRMFIWYIFVNHVLMIYDCIFVIPLKYNNLIVMYLIIAGIFLFIILYLYRKYGDRKTE
jgi:hypothetical protein